jgi:hypothetical protein
LIFLQNRDLAEFRQIPFFAPWSREIPQGSHLLVTLPKSSDALAQIFRGEPFPALATGQTASRSDRGIQRRHFCGGGDSAGA